MDPDQARTLGTFLRSHRLRANVSIGEVSRQTGVARAQIMRLEEGIVASPRADVLARFAELIGVKVADVYSLAGYTTPKELPSFTPYLRAKYGDLPEDAVSEMEQFFARLAQKHGTTGPADGEDEQ